jgi:hypothetical protein
VTVRFLADENIDVDIVQGLRSREPAIDILDVKSAVGGKPGGDQRYLKRLPSALSNDSPAQTNNPFFSLHLPPSLCRPPAIPVLFLKARGSSMPHPKTPLSVRLAAYRANACSRRAWRSFYMKIT